MKTQKTLMIATAAIALMVATAPVMAQTTTTTTKTTETVIDPLTATTNTSISSATTANGVVKETVTRVKGAAGTPVSTVVTTETAPVTTRSEMHVQTQEKTIAADGTRLFSISDFDINKDGVLTTTEVGEKLFGMYDFDGNGMIDNNEYEKNAVVTVTPVEKTTTITYDFNGDGVAEQQEKVYENFLHYTQLARFDGDKDGLSAREFVGRGYLEADIDGDKLISKKEWQGSYNAEIDRSNKLKGNLNK